MVFSINVLIDAYDILLKEIMDVKMMLINFVPIVLIVFFLGIYMPNLTRKEIFFGVRIPEDKRETTEVVGLKKQYIKNYLLICGLFLLAMLILAIYTKSENVFGVGIIIYVFIEIMVYYNTHKKVRKFKASQNWEEGKKEVVVIDTNFRNDKKMLISQLWFLIPISIIVINIIVGYKAYPNLPDKVAMQWNSQGVVTKWMLKSYKAIWVMPMTEIFMIAIMYMSYKFIGMAKVQISSSNPEVSREQNRRFRYIWSVCIIFLSTILMGILTVGQMSILQVVNLTFNQMMLATIIPTIIILIIVVIVSLITGQGGSRLKIKDNDINEGYIDRDDDEHWKMGMFYVNKNDPSLVVEKRFGIGWTMNFANPKAILMFVILVIFIIINVLISI